MCATRGKAARCVHAESSSCCTRFSSASVPFQKGMHDDGWGIGTTSIQRCFAGPFFSSRSSHFQFQRTFPGSSERWMMHAMMQLSAGFLEDLTAVAESRSVKRRRWGSTVSCWIAPRTEHVASHRSRRDKTGLAGGGKGFEIATCVVARNPERGANRRHVHSMSTGESWIVCWSCKLQLLVLSFAAEKKVKYFRQLRSGHACFFLHFLLQITKFLTPQNLKQCILRRAMYL